MKHIKTNFLNDSVYNFTNDCTKSQNATYGQGVLVGLVGGFMAVGYSFEESIAIVKQSRHTSDINPACVPESWKESLLG